MTTISSNTAALSSLVSLYAKADDSSETSASLTQAQKQNVVSMLEGSDSSISAGSLSTLLGTADSSTSSTDMSSILDAIQAQTAAGTTSAATTTGTGTGTSATDSTASTATTEQQKAATLMQSVYQSQQSNLFTLLA